jgi:hypothetical protein
MNSDPVSVIEELAEAIALDIPYEDKGKIHIKRTLVQPSKRGYVIFDTSKKQKVTETFSKSGAIAAAKANNDNDTTRLKNVVDLDRQLQKYYMDALFYRNTMRKSKDEFKRELTAVRYDIACEKVTSIRSAIESFVYDK